uniref:Uncharacterized protein n=1 Tax=Anguilla anguilla TaxID=7936 RepID=A0A0E9PAR4_ANGAN
MDMTAGNDVVGICRPQTSLLFGVPCLDFAAYFEAVFL